jgi:hypothetical protein
MFRALLVGSIALACVAAGPVGEAQPDANATHTRAAVSAPSLSQLLGFVDRRLVRADPETLRPLRGKRLAVGSGGCAPRSGGTACWSNPAWTVAPSGKRLAVARNDASSLLVVDAARMQVAERVKFGGGSIGALAWPVPTRLISIQEAAGERQRIVAFDLTAKRVVARRALDGTVTRLGRTPRGLVLLVAPAETIGEARVAVVDSRGAVRFARLERIVAGSKLLSGGGHRLDAQQPGLAVDAQGGRAFVVADNLVAEVDLRTLAVAYHELERPRSLLSRVWSWLEPVASAKQVSGYSREAQWLGANLIAISGSDAEGGRYEPAGLDVIDMHDWTARTLDTQATAFEATDGSLLATGWRWDSSGKRTVGTGVTAYGIDGAERFRLFDGEHAWLAQLYGGRAYVGLASAQDGLRIVDLAQGTVTGLRDPVLPQLLLGAGSGWWD